MCHRGEQAPAGVRIATDSVDWADRRTVAGWERVYDALRTEQMPPPGAPGLTTAEREGLLGWLKTSLTEHARIGGAVPRRLNRAEYENTIRALFDLPEFSIPPSFPADSSAHGFDTVGEALVLSPPLMAQYLEIATAVADQILPPARPVETPRTRRYSVGPDGLQVRQGTLVNSERVRLVSSRNMASHAAWPKRFEAAQSGVYRLELAAQAFQTEGMFYPRRSERFLLELYARQASAPRYPPFGEIRKLAVFAVPADGSEPTLLVAEIELARGEKFGLRWANGPPRSDPPKRDFSPKFLAERLTDRLFYAAMLEYRGGPRGTTSEELYGATVDLMESGSLDLEDPQLDELPKRWGGGLSNAPHNWIGEFVMEELERTGPALDVTAVAIEGPLRLVEDEGMRRSRLRTEAFLGQRVRGATDRDYAGAVLGRFLARAFRRPAARAEVAKYVEMALAAGSERLEDGLHLAVRRALVSPHFLYRGLRPGQLDEFDLAARLSYFLTSSPPDARLTELALGGRLGDRLNEETLRLIASPRSDEFVRHFTGQWLGTRVLANIMPDPRLLPFYDAHRRALTAEAEMLFAEILRENRPLATFVAPGFSYRNKSSNAIYGGNLEGNEMQRVTFERGGRHGGVVGLGAVMMATANGVDTHPVRRGVWLLENVLGMPPPPPPGNVPALAPDTSGATTLREQLAAHGADPSCNRCHKMIDPLGMVLESFDPVGRWRDHYPRYIKPPDGQESLSEEFYANVGKGVVDGPKVDSVGVLPDGTRLADVRDLKRYLIENDEFFARCLTEKLLVYGAGRPANFADRRVVDEIVADVREQEGGFRDLVVALVESEAFRMQ